MLATVPSAAGQGIDHVHDSSAARVVIAVIFTATGALISGPQVMGIIHHRRV